MSGISIRLLSSLVLAIALLCTQSPQMAGGGSDTEITGRIIDSIGNGVCDAAVRLISQEIVANPAAQILSTSTNDSGAYKFSRVIRGNYFLTAFTNDTLRAIACKTITVPDSSIELASDTMLTTGSIRGILVTGSQFRTIAVLNGTPFTATPDATGRYVLSNVPVGYYDVLGVVVNDSTRGITAIDWLPVNVSPSATARVDTLRLRELGAGTVLIDNFEDGDATNAIGTVWWSFDDRNEGGNSVVVPYSSTDKLIDTLSAASGSRSLKITYTLGNSFANPFLGVGTRMGPGNIEICPSRSWVGAKTLTLWLKGSGNHVNVVINSSLFPKNSLLLLDIPNLPASWTNYSIPLGVDDPTSWNLAAPYSAELVIGTVSGVPGDSGTIALDDVQITY